MDTKFFHDLLANAEKYHKVSPAHSNTFFDVAGYPHYENVASNILAFFLDSNEEHGLMDLWISSLMECYYNSPQHDKANDEIRTHPFHTDNEVVREEITAEGKRLDVIATTENHGVIAIENKIFAGAYNPWEDYHSHITKGDYSEYTYKFEILLSLSNIETDYINQGKYRFVNISYNDLLIAVKRKLGDYIIGANPKWLQFMFEFMTNIYHLMEGSMGINVEWQKFINSDNDSVADFLRLYEDDIANKNRILKTACERINTQIFDLRPISAKTYGTSRDKFNGHASIVVDFQIELGAIITYEAYYMKRPGKAESEKAGYLYLAIWDRTHSQHSIEESTMIFNVLHSLFAEDSVHETSDNRGWGRFLMIDSMSFADFSIDKFIDKSVKIIRTIHCSKDRFQ